MARKTILAQNLAWLTSPQGRSLKAHTLSKAAGLGGTFVRDIVEGRSTNPRTDSLSKLAEQLGYTLAEITTVKLWEAAQPGAPDLIAEERKGSLIVTIPASSSLRPDALKLLRHFAAAGTDLRQATMLRLQNPGLADSAPGRAAPAAPFSEDAVWDMAAEMIDGVITRRGLTLSKLERNRLIQDTAESVLARQSAADGASAPKRAVNPAKAKAGRVS